jgi:DNA-binding NtrC family response regulator
MPPAAAETFRGAKARIVGQFERDYLQEMLMRHNGNISRAARAAGKNRRAFYALMQKHKIMLRTASCAERVIP